MGKCRVNMKLDNDDCSGLLEYLDWQGRAVRPKQYPLRSRLRRRAWKLRRTLAGVHLRLEGKAVKKRPGLAGVLYTEFSGDSGLAIFRRLDAACQSAAKTTAQPEAMVSVAVRGRGRGYPSGGGGKTRDLSHIVCDGCYQKGHYKDKCPGRDQANILSYIVSRFVRFTF